MSVAAVTGAVATLNLWLILIMHMLIVCDAQLSVDFYKNSCPNVDQIVSRAMANLSAQSNVVPPATLRLLAHDCFVMGCDASILISSTARNLAERDAQENKNFPQIAFDAIVQIKSAVESACPRTVSCADILAMAARDAVVLTGGARWEVLKGRRDGLISQASQVTGRLPGSDFDATKLISNFAAVNLTAPDMVVLSGAHTIGFSHCKEFYKRLYNFSGTGKSDPTIEPSFAAQLKARCPQTGLNQETVQAFDVSTPFSFDNEYFKNLKRGRGLLVADQVLFNDMQTRDFVNELAESDEGVFMGAFARAMVKMSLIGIKTGTEGEIRVDCTAVNNRS